MFFLETIEDVQNEDLFSFSKLIIQLIKENNLKFFSCKNLRNLVLELNPSFCKKHDNKLKRSLSIKVSHVLRDLHEKGYIIKHNQKTWKLIKDFS